MSASIMSDQYLPSLEALCAEIGCNYFCDILEFQDHYLRANLSRVFIAGLEFYQKVDLLNSLIGHSIHG